MKFFSRYPEYQITYKPEQRIFTPTGEKVVTAQIETIEFHRCEFHTNDVDKIAYLLRNPSYGIDFYSEIHPSKVKDGTWVKEIEKYIEHDAVIDFELDKIKEKFGQKPMPIKTHDGSQQPAKFEEVKIPPPPKT